MEMSHLDMFVNKLDSLKYGFCFSCNFFWPVSHRYDKIASYLVQEIQTWLKKDADQATGDA